jgi:hypothetical protein
LFVLSAMQRGEIVTLHRTYLNKDGKSSQCPIRIQLASVIR